MKIRLVASLSAAVLLASCGTLPQADKQKARSPDTAFDYFKDLVRQAEYGQAHYMLSKETKEQVPSEAFAAGLMTYPTLKRVFLATRAEDVSVSGDAGRVRLNNPLLGVSREAGLVKEFGTIWTLHLGRQEMQELADTAREWVFEQFDASGGYHVFPPDYAFTPKKDR